MIPDKSREYRVVWEIEMWGTSPRDVATQALEIMQDADSLALHFLVTSIEDAGAEGVHVDLLT